VRIKVEEAYGICHSDFVTKARFRVVLTTR
jgi:hypothetical protein